MPSPTRGRLGIPAGLRLVLLALLLLPAFARRAEAHPHIFFDVHVKVTAEPDGGLGISYELYADHQTCVAMLCEGDENGDGIMTGPEMDYLVDLYGGFFRRHGYFVKVEDGDEIIDGKEIEVKAFRVLERKDKPRHFILAYATRVKVDPLVLDKARELLVELFDPTGYSAFTQQPKNAKVLPADATVKVAKVRLLPSQAGVGITVTLVPPPEPPPGGEAPTAAPPAQPAAVGVTEVAAPTLYARFKSLLRKGSDRIVNRIKRLSTDFDLGLFLSLMAFALGYGVFHALGPGHGKALVAAFVIRSPSKPWHAVALSLVVTLTHTGSSILLIYLLRELLQAILSDRIPKDQMMGIVGIVGGCLVVVIGLALIWRLVRESKEEQSEAEVTMGQVARWGMAIGLVPCPASMLIMMVSASVGVWWVGLSLVAALSVGLSVVLLVVAFATLYAKKGVANLADRKEGWGGRVNAVVAWGGNILVVGLGLFLIWYHIALV